MRINRTLLLKPMALARRTSVTVFLLPGSSIVTKGTRSGMINDTRKPILGAAVKANPYGTVSQAKEIVRKE
jgi:hypothetical protein